MRIKDIMRSESSGQNSRQSSTTEPFWNRDLFPPILPYLAWLRTPVGWLALLSCFSIPVGLGVGHQGWMVLGLCVSIMVMGMVWPWIQTRGLKAELKFSEETVVEESEFRIHLRIANRSPLPVWGLRVFGLEGLCDHKSLSYLPPWSTSEFTWAAEAEFRGKYPRMPLRLSSGFPFGMIECRRDIHIDGSLCVLPRLADARITLDGTQVSDSGKAATHQAAVSGQLRGLRPYRPGDSIKQCHWGQTARTGTLLVRENELPLAHAFQIEIDPAILPDAQKSEIALRGSLSLLRQLNREGFATTLLIGNRRWEIEGGKRGFAALLIQLCDWQWTGWETNAAADRFAITDPPPGLAREAVSDSTLPPVSDAALPANRTRNRPSVNPPTVLASVELSSGGLESARVKPSVNRVLPFLPKAWSEAGERSPSERSPVNGPVGPVLAAQTLTGPALTGEPYVRFDESQAAPSGRFPWGNRVKGVCCA